MTHHVCPGDFVFMEDRDRRPLITVFASVDRYGGLVLNTIGRPNISQYVFGTDFGERQLSQSWKLAFTARNEPSVTGETFCHTEQKTHETV